MTNREYKLSAEALEENLWMLTDARGNVPSENKAMFNVSFALRAILESVFDVELKINNLERKVTLTERSKQMAGVARRRSRPA